MTCANPNARGPAPQQQVKFTVRNFNLAATLSSGQAFRWQCLEGAWEGVVASRWVRLRSSPEGIIAQTATPEREWDWLSHYLQINQDLDTVLASFPDDPPMRAALAACPGLRLLRQDPWECLASFILSSSKQIVQIQQIIARLCRLYGPPLAALFNGFTVFDFPSPERIAACSSTEMRLCKMGFRDAYLLGAARLIANGSFDLPRLYDLDLPQARRELERLPGVGPKIADCVLLFAYGFQRAFPMDVWVRKALHHLYFRQGKVSPRQMQQFAACHFGPYAGYAQQYLFHYMRTSPQTSEILNPKS